MSVEIGIISDTHSFFDDRLPEIFQSVDEIWHAGDFGDMAVADQLADIKPLRGVWGNVDTTDLRERFEEDLFFEIEGVRIWMTHIAGRPRRYDPRVKDRLCNDPPDLLVCGHSHLLRIERDPKCADMMYVNPGAAGHHGFHKKLTLLKCTIDNGAVGKFRVIELGSRGRRQNKD